MAGILHRHNVLPHYRRAMRRERVIRDRTNPLDVYDDLECYQRFRLNRRGIMALVDMLREDLEHLTRRNSALSPECQTFIALRFYASGCFQNLTGDMINVSQPTASRVIRRVSIALQRRLNRYVKFPTSRAYINETKTQFYLDGGFPNVLGCVDCTHIRIATPSEHEWEYVNRKGWHSINVQLICDARLRITNCVVRWPGSTHDSRILSESGIYQTFEQNQHTGLLLGDSGYPLKKWLMVPFMNPATDAEMRYNRRHASTRSSIERCNGVLKRRFACLSTGIRMNPERACTVIMATIVLYNICLDNMGLFDQDDLDGDADGNMGNGHGNNVDITGQVARASLVAQYFQ